MKEELKTLLDAKTNLHKAQQNFKRVIKNRYPFLLNEDIGDFREDINNELEFLLSSATKNASTRIEIPSKHVGYKEGVVLTRKPGLKSPHDSYSAFDFTDVSKIDEKGDLWILKDREDEDKKIVRLSMLKTHGQILQEKLGVFYDFLRETILLMKDLDDFVPAHTWNEDNLPRVKVGDHRIKLQDKGFEYEIFNKNAKKGYDKFEDIAAEKITAYSPEFYADEEIIDMQDSLMTLLEDFNLLDSALKEQDLRKKNLIDRLQDLLNRLLEFNKPSKILRKLLVAN